MIPRLRLFARQMATTSEAASKARISYTPGPVEISMHQKISQALKPAMLEIRNDSSKHAHHSAMRAQGGGNGETRIYLSDFALTVVSDEFKAKPQLARHRLVNGLLKEEFETMGLHALSLRLKTPPEAEKEGILVPPEALTCKET